MAKYSYEFKLQVVQAYLDYYLQHQADIGKYDSQLFLGCHYGKAAGTGTLLVGFIICCNILE